jgi:acetoin utilization deacetylase AcuC-like enzyme
MTLAIISHPDCLLHDPGKHHPEQADRIRVIEKEIKNSNLEFVEYQAPKATMDQLCRVHDKSYIDFIFKQSPTSGFVGLDADTWMNPYSLQAALVAAGSGILAVDLVMTNQAKHVFCNIRPPGHHAEKNKAMGFCFFNNVAVAAAYAKDHYQLKRIAIVDFDVHHGNGTENIFQNDESILYCSSFESPFYPFSGADTQSSHILNIPLPAGTTGDIFREKTQEYWFENIIRFNPEIIFISAGFDGFIEDEMSDFMLTENDYAWITGEIKKIADETCQGRVISMLEGGYDLAGLGRCVLTHLQALSDMK